MECNSDIDYLAVIEYVSCITYNSSDIEYLSEMEYATDAEYITSDMEYTHGIDYLKRRVCHCSVEYIRFWHV